MKDFFTFFACGALTACGKTTASSESSSSGSNSDVSASSEVLPDEDIPDEGIQEASSAVSEDEGIYMDTTAPEADQIVTDVFAEAFSENGRMHCVFTACDYEGNEIWTKTTDAFPETELAPVGGLGLFGDKYYYYANHKVIALAAETGEMLWENPDFQGASASAVTDSSGNLYVCGYYGPLLMGIDSNGTTLFTRDSFEGVNVQWPHDLYYDEDTNSISMGVLDVAEQTDSVLVIHLDDLSASLE